MGHQCCTFGDPANYPTSGGEHFGVSVIGNPTKTTYRWLVGDNATGTLKVVGSPGNPDIPAPVNIPAPIWNVNQLPPPVPGLPPPPPVVVAVVQAPPAPPVPPGGKGAWGEAIWMKIYKTELPQAVELEDLVLGGAAVPDPEFEPPEVEWQLLQSPPQGKAGAWDNSENGGDAPVGDGNEAVSRRYEFYKYTGAWTLIGKSNEALCDNPTELAQQLPLSDRCGEPDANGVAGVGDLIGAQNAAVNLAPVCAVDVTTSITVKRSGYTFNFNTKLFSQRLTLTNTGNASSRTAFGGTRQPERERQPVQLVGHHELHCSAKQSVHQLVDQHERREPGAGCECFGGPAVQQSDQGGYRLQHARAFHRWSQIGRPRDEHWTHRQSIVTCACLYHDGWREGERSLHSECEHIRD